MTDDTTEAPTEAEQLADALGGLVADAHPMDERVVIFTYHTRLSAKAARTIGEHGFSVSTPGMIQYTHKELTKFGNDEPMEATFLAV